MLEIFFWVYIFGTLYNHNLFTNVIYTLPPAYECLRICTR